MFEPADPLAFSWMEEDPQTAELRIAQSHREDTERARAGESERKEEAAAHDRRAEKAAYLRERLEERAGSERRSGGE